MTKVIINNLPRPMRENRVGDFFYIQGNLYQLVKLFRDSNTVFLIDVSSGNCYGKSFEVKDINDVQLYEIEKAYKDEFKVYSVDEVEINTRITT